MSMPEFPNNTNLTREEAINQIISSIAMEELALSHIINAEGEKLQFVLGTIPGMTGPQPTIEQILEINESVRGVLQSAAETQAALRSKLQTALTASTMRGATGATGPTGPVMDVVGFQCEQLNGDDTLDPGENIMFNNILFQNDDVSFDPATRVFTLNQTGAHRFYLISYWLYVEGSGAIPYTLQINVNNAAYSTFMPSFAECQVNDSVIVPAGAGTFTFSISNASTDSLSLAVDGTQSKLTILGF